ncbi:MAG: hypothetical protein MHM6MM_003137 [Cercozoa sp. M6MM]
MWDVGHDNELKRPKRRFHRRVSTVDVADAADRQLVLRRMHAQQQWTRAVSVVLCLVRLGRVLQRNRQLRRELATAEKRASHKVLTAKLRKHTGFSFERDDSDSDAKLDVDLS